jgi:hypothetical protein
MGRRPGYGVGIGPARPLGRMEGLVESAAGSRSVLGHKAFDNVEVA